MPKVMLRKATVEDSATLFEWRNCPEIVAMGKTGKTVEWAQHVTWFGNILGEPQSHLLLMILLEGSPVGQIRFDKRDPRTCEVSIYLIPGYTGQGIGVKALSEGCSMAFDALKVQEIVAEVRRSNRHSIVAFQKAGFVSQGEGQSDDEFLRLTKCGEAEIPHNRLTFDESEVHATASVVRSGHWASGPMTLRLERRLAELAGVEHAVCVSSGSSALRLALKAMGVAAGSNVLVPAYSCVALANAVLACDAGPVAVDVTAGDWNLNGQLGKSIHQAIPARVAIMVDTFGTPAATGILEEAGIPVIEDCAHGFGIEVEGRLLGGRSRAAILSFYATKLIGAGEGGAVLTNSVELAEFVRDWRDYTDKAPHGKRRNDKMTDIAASLAMCQLDRLPSMLASRQQLAERYDQALAGVAQDENLFHVPDIRQRRVWYRYAVESLATPAAEIVKVMARAGVHAAEPVTDWRQLGMTPCPIADGAYARLVSLPLYPSLAHAEQRRVIDVFLEACRTLAQG